MRPADDAHITPYVGGPGNGPGTTRLRLAWSAGALMAVARRWAGFLIVAAAVLGIGYLVAAIGWPALPALWAATLPPAEGIAVVLLHSLPATALAWGLREALLPAHWLAAERALPLRAGQRAAADLAVAALAQSPLFALYGLSLLSWWHADPVWLRGHWPAGIAFVAASITLSLAGAVALLAWRRRLPRPRRSEQLIAVIAGAPRSLSAWHALILLPLWRGPARPVLTTLLLTLAGLLLCLLGATAIWPDEPRWCLAGYAALAMAGCTRAYALAQRSLEPLLAAAAPLPIRPGFGPLALRLLALSPALLAWPALALLLVLGQWPLAPLAAPLFALAAVLAPALQLWSPATQPEPRAALWMLCLVLSVALATEILR